MSRYHVPTFAPGVVLGLGSKGPDVRLLQELLTLAGHDPRGIDGEAGPNTATAIRAYQKAAGLDVDGEAGPATLTALCAPYLDACRIDLPAGCTLGEAVALVAEKLLRLGARELPGNRGPWVRQFCDGMEGPAYPWCAGFTRHCQRVAEDAPSAAARIMQSLSCTTIGRQAAAAGCLMAPAVLADLRRGDLLLRGEVGRYEHVEIVVGFDGQRVRIIAGNTNNNGSREGIAVMAHTHGLAGYDAVRL